MSSSFSSFVTLIISSHTHTIPVLLSFPFHFSSSSFSCPSLSPFHSFYLFSFSFFSFFIFKLIYYLCLVFVYLDYEPFCLFSYLRLLAILPFPLPLARQEKGVDDILLPATRSSHLHFYLLYAFQFFLHLLSLQETRYSIFTLPLPSLEGRVGGEKASPFSVCFCHA